MNVVAHNLVAMNASRMFGITTTKKDKVTEKLSSGYKINRAADDAAGLAISEKMRRQIKGLTRASENAQDGISLVQVADGALNEMHDIMQRVNQLAVQSANDTNSREDRGYLQQEVDQLRSEINRISRNTSFNEIYLFDMGSLVDLGAADYDNVPFDESAVIGGVTKTHSKTMDFSKIDAGTIDDLVGKSFSVKCSQGCSQVFKFSFNKGSGSSIATAPGAGADRPSLNVNIDITGMTSGADITQKIYDLAVSKETDIKTAYGGSLPAAPSGSVYIGHDNGISLNGSKLVFFSMTNAPSGKIMAADMQIDSRKLDLQVGAEAGQFISVNLYKINAGTLGIADIDITTSKGCGDAIKAVKGGIEKLSSYRSYYGAVQNRLEHTIKNLDNVVENTTAAESQIRDTDMAKAMVEFSNLEILSQAGISMMTQANQANSNILSLLS